MEDIFTIANKNFNSRLIVGTGKYKSLEETANAVKASGADLVTVPAADIGKMHGHSLTEKGLKVKMMNGKTTIKERKFIGLPYIKDDDWTNIFLKSKYEKHTNTFQKLLMPFLEPDVLLVQIQSCCEGLNLQQFNNVIFTSPHWNPAVEDQAICRAHRLGQKKKVKVYKYIVKPNLSYHNNEIIHTISLDEHCNNIQEKKREAMRKFAQNASEERRDIPE